MLVIAALLAFAIQNPSPDVQAQATQAPTALPPVEAATGDLNEPDPNREICRRRVASVGSNRTRRVCAPAWQWEQARQDTRNELLRNAHGSAQTPGAGATGGDAPPGRGF